MIISIVTPTRDRPEQFSLIVDCINKQTRKPDEWIIADDGKNPLPASILNKIQVKYVYMYYPSGLSRSVCYNSAKALELALGDTYLIIEDDDYYPPTYIEHVSSLTMDSNTFIANSRWADYRLSTGYYRILYRSQSLVDAGICRLQWHTLRIGGDTGKQELIKNLYTDPEGRFPEHALELVLKSPLGYKLRLFDYGIHSEWSLKDYGVGTPGVVKRHRSNDGMTSDDENFSLFKSELGEDWVRYADYLGRLRDVEDTPNN